MGNRRRFVNPFYFLLIVAGTVFCVTAFAYGIMTVRALRGESAAALSAGGAALLAWLDRHGLRLMMIELGVLAISTLLAITTDNYWERRAAK